MISFSKLITFILILTLTSCGYFNDAPLEEEEIYKVEELEGTCNLDPDEFEFLFEKNVEVQIKCLEENLELFKKFVKTDTPNGIGNSEITKFASRFFQENAQAVAQSLSLIFELNMIFLRDNKNLISDQNIGPLIKLLIYANRDAVRIVRSLKNIRNEEGDYNENRKEFEEGLKSFSANTLSIIDGDHSTITKLNLNDFLTKINETIFSDLDEELINSLLLIKKVLIGGDKEILTSDELVELIKILPKVFVSVIDLSFPNTENLTTDEQYSYYKKRVEDLSSILESRNEDEALFSTDEISSLISRLMKETFSSEKLSQIDRLIKKLKPSVIGGDKNIFSVKDIKIVFDYAVLGINGATRFSKISDIYKNLEKEKIPKASKEIDEYFKSFQTEALLTFRKNRIPAQNINLVELIQELKIAMEDFIPDDLPIYSLINLKKIITGGKNGILTPREFRSLIRKTPDIFKATFDLLLPLKFTEIENIHLLKEPIIGLIDVIEKEFLLIPNKTKKDSEIFLSIEDLTLIADYFTDLKEDLQLSKHKAQVTEIKKSVTSSNQDNFTNRDIKDILGIAKIGLEGISFYKENQKDLESISLQNNEQYKERLWNKTNTTINNILEIVKDPNHFPAGINVSNIIKNIEPFIDFSIDTKTYNAIVDFSKIVEDTDQQIIKRAEILKIIEQSKSINSLIADLFTIKNNKESLQISSPIYLSIVKNIRPLIIDSLNGKTPIHSLAILGDYFLDLDNKLFSQLEILKESKINLLKGNRENLTSNELKPLINIAELAIRTSDQFNTFIEYTDDNSKENFLQRSGHLNELFRKVGPTIVDFLHSNNLFIGSLDYFKLAENVFELFSDKKVDINKFSKVRILKPLWVGGKPNYLTNEELKIIAKNLEEVVDISFRAGFSENSFFDENHWFGMWADITLKFKNLIQVKQSKGIPFIEVARIIDDINSKKWDLEKKYNILEKIKGSITGNENANTLNLTDGKNLLTFVGLGFDLLHYINLRADITKNITASNYEDSKINIIDTADRITRKIKNDLESSLKLSQIDIIQLIDNYNELVSVTDDLKTDINYHFLTDISGIKKYLFGGEKNILTQDEIYEILQVIPQFEERIFPVLYGKEEYGISKKDSSRDILKLIRFTTDMATQYKDDNIFKINEIVRATNYLLDDDDLNLAKFVPSIRNLKTRIIGGDKKFIKRNELNKGLDLANELFESHYFTEYAFKKYKKRLSSKELNISIPIPSTLELEQLFDDDKILQLREDFLHIANNYHFYREDREKGQQFYSVGRIRTLAGTHELQMLRLVFKELLKGYGTKVQNLKSGAFPYAIDLEGIDIFFKEIKILLIEFDLWSTNLCTFSRNMLLLIDLFQYQSNGSLQVDLEEGTEYGALILSAIGLADEIEEKINCQKIINDKGQTTYDATCFRNNYFDTLLYRSSFGHTFIELRKFYKNDGELAAYKLLRNTEGFSRDTPIQTEPITSHEVVLITGALLNIESTLLRFDKDGNNHLNGIEMDKAFEVYKDTIITIADLTGFKERFAKSVFLFMLKEMKIPSTGELMRFHLFGDKKNIKAGRINIAAILKYLVEEANKMPSDCNMEEEDTTEVVEEFIMTY